MVGLPKKKISSARRGQRRSHDHLVPPTLTICPQCRQPKPTHRVCWNCGMYNGIDILHLEARRKESE